MSDPSHTIRDDDRGLLLGDGLFETVRLYEGRPFRLDAHLERLRGGAARVGIPVPSDLEDRISSALTEWRGGDGSLRVTLTRGSGAGLLPNEEADSRLIVQVRSVARGSAEKGLAAVVRGRVEERALVAGLKVLGYLERIQALRVAREAGADEALLQNSQDLVVEGSASNVIAVANGVLVAPGPKEGALPGITRSLVLGEARRLGRVVEERGIGVGEIGSASEILLTSSVREIVSVVHLEGRPVGKGEPGPVGRELGAAFREVVELELYPP